MDETELVNGLPHYLVRQRDTKEKLGISHKTFYKYAKKYHWQSREGAAGAIIWMIPETEYHAIREMYRANGGGAPEGFAPNLRNSEPVPVGSESEKLLVRPVSDDYIAEVRRGYELAIEAHKAESATLREQNETLKSQMKSLNNELDARNTAIIKYKDQEKDRDAFLTAIREEFEKREKARSWWRFWG
jgi:predicted HTH domain antitoxin